MIELHSWPKHAVPREIAIQIRSFIRMQWPFLNGTGGRIWDFAPRADEPTTFALVDDEILVSHAEMNFRIVEFQSRPWKVGGLSAVFTYPAFRGTGCASRIVNAATDALCKGSADLAMLFCGSPLEGFYTAHGWTPMKSTRVMFGDPANPALKQDNLAMMLFISEGGKTLRSALSNVEIYVGTNTW